MYSPLLSITFCNLFSKAWKTCFIKSFPKSFKIVSIISFKASESTDSYGILFFTVQNIPKSKGLISGLYYGFGIKLNGIFARILLWEQIYVKDDCQKVVKITDISVRLEIICRTFFYVVFSFFKQIILF